MSDHYHLRCVLELANGSKTLQHSSKEGKKGGFIPPPAMSRYLQMTETLGPREAGIRMRYHTPEPGHNKGCQITHMPKPIHTHLSATVRQETLT